MLEDYSWYSLFDRAAFEAEGLISRTLDLFLEDVGAVEILITKAGLTSILYDGTFLPINFIEENPYARDGYAVYEDDDGMVWLGIEVEDEE